MVGCLPLLRGLGALVAEPTALPCGASTIIIVVAGWLVGWVIIVEDNSYDNPLFFNYYQLLSCLTHGWVKSTKHFVSIVSTVSTLGISGMIRHPGEVQVSTKVWAKRR